MAQERPPEDVHWVQPGDSLVFSVSPVGPSTSNNTKGDEGDENSFDLRDGGGDEEDQLLIGEHIWADGGENAATGGGIDDDGKSRGDVVDDRERDHVNDAMSATTAVAAPLELRRRLLEIVEGPPPPQGNIPDRAFNNGGQDTYIVANGDTSSTHRSTEKRRQNLHDRNIAPELLHGSSQRVPYTILRDPEIMDTEDSAEAVFQRDAPSSPEQNWRNDVAGEEWSEKDNPDFPMTWDREVPIVSRSDRGAVNDEQSSISHTESRNEARSRPHRSPVAVTASRSDCTNFDMDASSGTDGSVYARPPVLSVGDKNSVGHGNSSSRVERRRTRSSIDRERRKLDRVPRSQRLRQVKGHPLGGMTLLELEERHLLDIGMGQMARQLSRGRECGIRHADEDLLRRSARLLRRAQDERDARSSFEKGGERCARQGPCRVHGRSIGSMIPTGGARNTLRTDRRRPASACRERPSATSPSLMLGLGEGICSTDWEASHDESARMYTRRLEREAFPPVGLYSGGGTRCSLKRRRPMSAKPALMCGSGWDSDGGRARSRNSNGEEHAVDGGRGGRAGSADMRRFEGEAFDSDMSDISPHGIVEYDDDEEGPFNVDELERVAASYLLRPRTSPPRQHTSCAVEDGSLADDGSVYIYREGDCSSLGDGEWDEEDDEEEGVCDDDCVGNVESQSDSRARYCCSGDPNHRATRGEVNTHQEPGGRDNCCWKRIERQNGPSFRSVVNCSRNDIIDFENRRNKGDSGVSDSIAVFKHNGVREASSSTIGGRATGRDDGRTKGRACEMLDERGRRDPMIARGDTAVAEAKTGRVGETKSLHQQQSDRPESSYHHGLGSLLAENTADSQLGGDFTRSGPREGDNWNKDLQYDSFDLSSRADRGGRQANSPQQIAVPGLGTKDNPDVVRLGQDGEREGVTHAKNIAQGKIAVQSTVKVKQVAIRLREMILDRQAAARRSLRQVFGHFDRRGCGYVSAAEMRDALADLRLKVSPDEAKDLHSTLALDGGDRLSFGEFAVFVSDPYHSELEAQVCQQAAEHLEALGRRSFNLDAVFRKHPGPVRKNPQSSMGTTQSGPTVGDEINAVVRTDQHRAAMASQAKDLYQAPFDGEGCSGVQAAITGTEGQPFPLPVQHAHCERCDLHVVSAANFVAGLETLGLRLSASDTRRLLVRFDVHGDGFLSTGRFAAMIEKSRPWIQALAWLAHQEEADEEADACLRAHQLHGRWPTVGEQALSDDVVQMARYIGIRVSSDAALLWIATDALAAPKPAGWAMYQDQEGRWFYHNELTGHSRWDHPLDPHFRQVYLRERFGDAHAFMGRGDRHTEIIISGGDGCSHNPDAAPTGRSGSRKSSNGGLASRPPIMLAPHRKRPDVLDFTADKAQDIRRARKIYSGGSSCRGYSAMAGAAAASTTENSTFSFHTNPKYSWNTDRERLLNNVIGPALPVAPRRRRPVSASALRDGFRAPAVKPRPAGNGDRPGGICADDGSGYLNSARVPYATQRAVKDRCGRRSTTKPRRPRSAKATLQRLPVDRHSDGERRVERQEGSYECHLETVANRQSVSNQDPKSRPNAIDERWVVQEAVSGETGGVLAIGNPRSDNDDRHWSKRGGGDGGGVHGDGGGDARRRSDEKTRVINGVQLMPSSEAGATAALPRAAEEERARLLDGLADLCRKLGEAEMLPGGSNRHESNGTMRNPSGYGTSGGTHRGHATSSRVSNDILERAASSSDPPRSDTGPARGRGDTCTSSSPDSETPRSSTSTTALLREQVEELTKRMRELEARLGSGSSPRSGACYTHDDGDFSPRRSADSNSGGLALSPASAAGETTYATDAAVSGYFPRWDSGAVTRGRREYSCGSGSWEPKGRMESGRNKRRNGGSGRRDSNDNPPGIVLI